MTGPGPKGIEEIIGIVVSYATVATSGQNAPGRSANRRWGEISLDERDFR